MKILSSVSCIPTNLPKFSNIHKTKVYSPFSSYFFKENRKFLCNGLREESSEEAFERRLRESREVEERVILLHDKDEFEKEVIQAGNLLVVLEASSQDTCDSGLMEEPEIQWKQEQVEHEKLLQQECEKIKHIFQRTARDCPDVKFVAVDADTEEGSKLCDILDIDTVPTLQFFKNGKMLWQHKGVLHLQQDLGEGMLFYGNTYGKGAKASQFISEIRSKADLKVFLEKASDETLCVLDVSSSNAEPCIRIYPAVLALAKNFSGYAAFARLIYDESQETAEIARDLNILEVPCFVFYRKGMEVDRHVGSSRGDLIGHILSVQNKYGIAPPPPPSKGQMGRGRKASVS